MSMSSSDSSSSSSSATPPPSIPVPKNKKSSKNKGKKNSQAQGKNEGADLNWAFAPPPGFTILEEEEAADAGEFDWDKINDDEDLELCLIRLPDSVKPKYLENLQLHEPISSVSPRSGLVGSLKRKHMTFDIWSVGDSDDQPVGGEELKGLSCLLPRKKKKGKLYPASKPFAHHLMISARSVVPTPCAPSAGDPQVSISTGPPYKNPPRQSYPKEVLKHQFMPYGSLVNVTTNDRNEMDIDKHEEEIVVDVDIEKNPEPQLTVSPKGRRKQGKTVNETQLEPLIDPSTTTESQSEGKKAKGKKRKVESMADSSVVKKPKKVKTSG